MLRLRSINLSSIAFIALALSACGGGGRGHRRTRRTPPSTFTVGGTVSGLSGSVVLRLNGGNDLTVNAPGTFTFSTALSNSASYSVSIVGQPNTQVCGPGVTNGSGTISGANVNNLSVSCANYSVGGTVSRADGSGLVLQVIGGNDSP